MAFAQGSKCGREPARPPAIFKNVSRSTEGWGLSSGFESTSVFSAGNTRRGPMDRTTARGAAPQSPAAALPSVATDAHWRPTAGRPVLSSVGQGRLQTNSLAAEFGHFLLLICLVLS